MTAAPLASRLADLQIPISQIRSLALSAGKTIDEMSGVESAEHRDALGHASNFADIITAIASRLAEDVEQIERDAPPRWVRL